jgi:primary-amine oxidase
MSQTTTGTAVSVAHPLDPLSAEEILAARAVLDTAGLLRESTRFSLVQLQEPDKAAVLAHRPGDPVERRVAAVLLDVGTGEVLEVVVSVTRREIVSRTPVDTASPPYGQPTLLTEDSASVVEIVVADPRWQEAMAARGITDTRRCDVLPLAPGQFGHPDEVGRRIVRAFTLYREDPNDSPWARPVEGVVAVVDLTSRKVLRLEDHGAVPLPPETGNFRSGDHGPDRTDVRRLEITQPDGPGFTLDGNVVRWQNWSFRIGFDVREGLVLHQLAYDDGGRERSICYRASISEMVVPYADPHPARSWISYFDAGEYGLGKLATPLVLGCDCLGEIRYLDAVFADDHGLPCIAPNVVCVHEEDHGVLWKHSDFFTGLTETRRARRLAVSFFTAIGNYDYGFFWYLYQDGTIELEAKLTGVLFANAQADGQANPHATQVAPGLVAPHHQHLFSARLDMTVDGVANAVEEVDVVALPQGADNPAGNAFTTRTTVLASEASAARTTDTARSRTWRVVNRGSRNRFGAPVAYRLRPHPGPTLLAAPGSSVARRAAFATKHLWVTRYHPEERYAAGDYPNQHAGGAGLPAWTAADRPLDGEDVVLWHTFGTTHVPRPEDWPVMPVARVGFALEPDGFFDRNPALDVPPPSPACH